MEILTLITRILVAVVSLCFVVITPKIEAWINAKTSAIENAELRSLVTAFVSSAEQTIKGDGKGAEKKAQVTAELIALGYELTEELNAYIESAVRNL